MNAPSRCFLLLAALSIAAAPFARAQREKLPPDDLAWVQEHFPQAKKTSTGIRYIVLREGTGEVARPGDKALVLYTGRLLNGKIFDQRLDPKEPFAVHVRRGEVIEGWDQILQFMKKGEKRIVIIPPELAYGTRGQPPDIPRDATLVFEMEILDIVRTHELRP
ncbi:MAG TPA: FKBP-type peptidyl-prolyl cis-trans isomerase [Opitutaceae bacterium]|nr:FKBP-type peptidyl-prolyl cis-trans isomerase [Opitutaceae bacterium]